MTDQFTDRSSDSEPIANRVGLASRESLARTDGRTDGLTKKDSPTSESSLHASPAGGLSDSTSRVAERGADAPPTWAIGTEL